MLAVACSNALFHRHLLARGLTARCTRLDARPASTEELTTIHSDDHVAVTNTVLHSALRYTKETA